MVTPSVIPMARGTTLVETTVRGAVITAVMTGSGMTCLSAVTVTAVAATCRTMGRGNSPLLILNDYDRI